jgi:hypothetical protein
MLDPVPYPGSATLLCIHVLFQATAGFLVNVSQGVFYPDWWRMALARSYLAHQDLNTLITILFVVSRKVIKTVRVSRLSSLFFYLVSNPLLRIRNPVPV